jgi:acetoin utilization deacetylase AcuC-like enzyme
LIYLNLNEDRYLPAKKKIGIAFDESSFKHDTGIWHPESSERLKSVSSAIDDLSFKYITIEPRIAGVDELQLVHSQKYVEFISSIDKEEPIMLDADTVFSPGTKEASLKAVGSVLNSVDSIKRNKIDRAFCAVRPPGHHAEPDRAMGFCIFNNVAIGAAYALKQFNLIKIVIIDWDLHHGNGTQKAFYDDKNIFYISLHQFPYYPGTGSKQETGEGDGKGFILNIPMDAGSGDKEYSKAFEKVIIPAIKKYSPEMIFISAGFDAHEDDHLGGINLTTEFFGEMTSMLTDSADDCCDGRMVSVLEGGYNLAALRDCVKLHIEELAK